MDEQTTTALLSGGPLDGTEEDVRGAPTVLRFPQPGVIPAGSVLPDDVHGDLLLHVHYIYRLTGRRFLGLVVYEYDGVST